MATRELTITVDTTRSVSGLLTAPPDARALYVFGHGAGVGMTHKFMTAIADGLNDRGIATLRYNFPYMERGEKRPDPAKVAQATVRAACAEAVRRMADIPLFAGGKSYGGRMTSQAQAEAPLDGVKGLAFLGFPLHPSKEPSDERGEHLARVKVPMLFLTGTRDDLADLSLLTPLVEKLGPRATLHIVEGGDHSFLVLKSSERKPHEVMSEVVDALVQWMDSLIR